MINVVPYTLNFGFMLDVHFSPRVNVSCMCAPSLIPLTARVRKIASMTSSFEWMFSNPNALADLNSRFKCLSNLNILPL